MLVKQKEELEKAHVQVSRVAQVMPVTDFIDKGSVYFKLDDRRPSVEEISVVESMAPGSE
jgi:hypothetical protein